MNNWKDSLLSEVVSISPSNVDKVIHPHERQVLLCNYMDAYMHRYLTSDHPFSAGSAKSSEWCRFQLRKNDVLITKDSETPDDIAIPSILLDQVGNLVCGYHLAILRPDHQKINALFLLNLLQISKFKKQFSNSANGITRYGLTKAGIANVTIRYPLSLDEQSEMAEILFTTDEAIEATEKIIAKRKRQKEGLMRALFRYGLDEKGHLRSDKTHEFKDSVLGNIPVDWDVEILANACSKITDRDHTTPVYVQDGVPIVSPKDFNDNHEICFSHCAMISRKAHLVNRRKTDLQVNDIVFTRIGAGLGKACIVKSGMPEFSILHSAAMIRSHGKVLPIFLLYTLKSFYVQKQIMDGIQSIGVPDLGMDKMNSLVIKFPTRRDEQELIGAMLSSIDSAIGKEQDYRDKLLAQKRGLMEDLLTGKVRVNHLIKKGITHEN